jgi:copper chaperone
MPSIPVKGMTCEHCKLAVAEAVAAIPGVASVVVDLRQARAEWVDANSASPVSPEKIREAVRRVGFDAG